MMRQISTRATESILREKEREYDKQEQDRKYTFAVHHSNYVHLIQLYQNLDVQEHKSVQDENWSET